MLCLQDYAFHKWELKGKRAFLSANTCCHRNCLLDVMFRKKGSGGVLAICPMLKSLKAQQKKQYSESSLHVSISIQGKGSWYFWFPGCYTMEWHTWRSQDHQYSTDLRQTQSDPRCLVLERRLWVARRNYKPGPLHPHQQRGSQGKSIPPWHSWQMQASRLGVNALLWKAYSSAPLGSIPLGNKA